MFSEGVELSVYAVAVALWLLLQLLALSWPARTVRPVVVIAATLAGMYGSAALAFGLQSLVNATVAGVVGVPVTRVVETAGSTYDPFLEELAKLSPLVFLLAVSAPWVRRQWGLTDHLVIGAALGAGFGFLEVVAAEPSTAEPVRVLGTHLGITALAGLGVGLLSRFRGIARLVGPLLLLSAVVLHIRANVAVAHPEHPVADGWFAVAAWLVPSVGLAAALLADIRVVRASKRRRPDLLLASERAGVSSARAVSAVARLRLPYSAFVVLRYVRLRRSVCYAGVDLAGVDPARAGCRATADGSASHGTRLWQLARSIRADLDAANRVPVWRRLERARLREAARAAGASPVPPSRAAVVAARAVAVAAAVPVCLFVLAGSFPAFDGLRQVMVTESGMVLALLATLAGAAFLLWRAVQLTLTCRRAGGYPLPDPIALVRLNLLAASGAAAGGVVLVGALVAGLSGSAAPVPGVHLHLMTVLPNAPTELLCWLALGFVPAAAVGVAPPASVPSAAIGALGSTMLRLASDRGGGFGAGTTNPPDPRTLPARLDRSMRELRPSEQRTALLLAQQERFRGRTFRRPDSWNPAAMHVDWVDDAGGRYDAYGAWNSASPDGDMRRFLDRLDMHLVRDVDYTVVDLTGFGRWQVALVAAHLENPPPGIRDHLHKVIRVGF